jgi:hypothetical protein
MQSPDFTKRRRDALIGQMDQTQAPDENENDPYQPPPPPDAGTPTPVPPSGGVNGGTTDPPAGTPPAQPYVYDPYIPPVGNSGGGPFDQAVRDLVAKLMAQDPSKISINDPELANAAESNYRGLDRARQAERSAMAERAAAQGLGDSGAMDAGVESGFQNMGESQGAFQSKLVLDKMSEMKSQITQALQVGAGILSSDQNAALQRDLANLNAAMQAEGLKQSDKHFYDDLGFRIGQSEADQNRAAILALLGGG